MSGKTYTFTVRRSRLVIAVACLVVTVGTLVLFGAYAWLVNAGLVLLAGWLLSKVGGRRVVVRDVQQVDDGPSKDAHLIADEIRTASLRDMVMRDMRGGL